MSEINFDFSGNSENIKNINNKPSNIKKNLFHVNNYDKTNEANKSLLIVEKLSRMKNNNSQFGRYNMGLKKDEIKLINPNRSDITDYDKDLAFNLANNIVRRRFKYFWTKNRDDSEENLEYKKPIIRVKKHNRLNFDIQKLEEEQKRKEKERIEKEKAEKERIEREKKEKEKKKKKEKVKKVEINIEEKNRENHNYKIIQKLTTEVEVSDKSNSNKNNNKKLTKKNNNSSKDFRTLTEYKSKNKFSWPLFIKSEKPELKTKKILITKENKDKNTNTNIINNINMIKIEINKNKNTIIKEIKDNSQLIKNINNINNIKHEKDAKIENNKLIIVNKLGKINKNNEINKIVLQKNVIKKDIILNKDENNKTEGNIRNKYKNLKNKNI